MKSPLRTPEARYRFHLCMVLFWALTMAAAPFLACFRGVANFGPLLIMEVSLWANLATHLGALDSSKASEQTEDLP